MSLVPLCMGPAIAFKARCVHLPEDVKFDHGHSLRWPQDQSRPTSWCYDNRSTRNSNCYRLIRRKPFQVGDSYPVRFRKWHCCIFNSATRALLFCDLCIISKETSKGAKFKLSRPTQIILACLHITVVGDGVRS